MPKNKSFEIVGHPDDDINLELLNYFGMRRKYYPAEWTLLMCVVMHQKVGLAKILISNGACPNIIRGRNYDSPLLIAAETANTKMINLLVDSGADIFHKNSFEWTALHKLCKSSNIQMIKFLVQRGANISAETSGGDTPLHIEFRLRKSVHGASFLIEHGANLEFKNGKGQTSLHVACLYNNDEGVSMLLKKGPKISAIDDRGRTPFALLEPENPQTRHLPNIEIMIQAIPMKQFLDTSSVSQNDLDLIEKNEFHKKFFQNCKADLIKMKRTEFYAPYSLISIASNSVVKLANLTKNQEFVQKFKLKVRGITFYREYLEEIFQQAVEINKEMIAVESRLNSIFKKSFPNLILRKIAKNLRVEDLPVQ